jgi:hypothetical protein
MKLLDINHHVECESETAPIIIDNVNSRSLLKVVEYCTVHNDPSISMTDLKIWDNKFVKVEPSVLCELASVSHLLFIYILITALHIFIKCNTYFPSRRMQFFLHCNCFSNLQYPNVINKRTCFCPLLRISSSISYSFLFHIYSILIGSVSFGN